MTRPTLMQAIEAAKYLRRIATDDTESHSAVRTLLHYTHADRWRFGWNVTDFGDIVAHVGPPEDFGVPDWHHETPTKAVTAAELQYGIRVSESVERQFKLMGVM